jgi:putative ABC transport system permease protein
MTLLDSFLSALQSLRANVMRSVLTALGMIIGVAAVIIMVAVGSGAQQGIEDVIESIGSNLLIVQPASQGRGGVQQGAGTGTGLTAADAEAMFNEIPEISAVAPTVRGQGQVVFGNANWHTSIEGITNSYMEVRSWSVADGRQFEEWEVSGGAKVVLIGNTVAENLFPGEEAIGQMIRVERVPFEVIGVLAAKGQSSFGQDQDDLMFVPLKTAKQRIVGGRAGAGDNVQTIYIQAQTSELVAYVEIAIAELLRHRHGLIPGQDDDFRIRNISEMLGARQDASKMMALLLAAVASVSLIVGGIGIMNIMLVSVTERTREIGVRMAVGAARGDILTQFLIEAVVISVIGGIIGIILGAGGSQAAAALGDWPLRLEGSSVLLAFGFSAAVGIFFGYYPARKAAHLDPIEALRHE